MKTNKINGHISLLEGADFYYQNDLWDISQHPKFEDLKPQYKQELSRTETSRILNFSICKNTYIKEELKYFAVHMLNNRDMSLYTFGRRMWFKIKKIIEFVNEYNLDVKSIVFINLDELERNFRRYIFKQGIQLYNKSSIVVSGEMEERQDTIVSPYIQGLRQYYNFYKTLYNEEQNMYNRDIWELEQIVPKEELSCTNSRTLNFSKIKQEGVKLLTKKYTRQQLNVKSVNTIRNHLKSIITFSEYLTEQYPNLNTLEELNEDIMEEYLQYIEIQDYSKGTKQLKIVYLKKFFEICILNKWEYAPNKVYIRLDNIPKPSKTLTNYIENEVVQQLNENLDDLPINIARMIVVLQYVGMRISELINLKMGSVKTDFNNDYYLEYYQFKVKRYNRVPITEEVAQTLLGQEDDTKQQYGEDTEYVFARDKENPIKTTTFSYYINKMSFNKKIKDKDGKLFRFKSHMFRATVATKYINLGVSPNIIRTLLGHKSFQSLNHYAQLFDSTVVEALEGVLDKQNEMILKIGSEDSQTSVKKENREENLIPLPNGSCAKPISEGLCYHANACLTCSVFRPNPKDLPLFTFQLQEAKNNLKITEINGFERLYQVNKDLVDNLEKIIAEIKRSEYNE